MISGIDPQIDLMSFEDSLSLILYTFIIIDKHYHHYKKIGYNKDPLLLLTVIQT